METAKTDKILADILETVRGAVEAHGGEAAELAGRVYQLDAMGDLLWPIAMLFLAGLCAFAARPLWRCCHAVHDIDKEFAFGAGTIVVGIVGCMALVVAIIGVADNILNPLIWVSATDPEVALARALLAKL